MLKTAVCERGSETRQTTSSDSVGGNVVYRNVAYKLILTDCELKWSVSDSSILNSDVINCEYRVSKQEHHTYTRLDKLEGSVRIIFFDFSSAFNAIQPALLVDPRKIY